MADPWSDRIPAQLTDREDTAPRQQLDVIARIVQEMREHAKADNAPLLMAFADRLASALASSGAPPQLDAALWRLVRQWRAGRHYEYGTLTGPAELITIMAEELEGLLTQFAKVRPSQQQAWRPIATAPKDGNLILVCQYDNLPFIARWTNLPFDGYFRCGGQADGVHPTHWQPLPPPPSSPPGIRPPQEEK